MEAKHFKSIINIMYLFQYKNITSYCINTLNKYYIVYNIETNGKEYQEKTN